MRRERVGHKEIASFAQEKVNLPKKTADELLAQVARLRENSGKVSLKMEGL